MAYVHARAQICELFKFFLVNILWTVFSYVTTYCTTYHTKQGREYHTTYHTTHNTREKQKQGREESHHAATQSLDGMRQSTDCQVLQRSSFVMCRGKSNFKPGQGVSRHQRATKFVGSCVAYKPAASCDLIWAAAASWNELGERMSWAAFCF